VLSRDLGETPAGDEVEGPKREAPASACAAACLSEGGGGANGLVGANEDEAGSSDLCRER
jgi:hypothetical protein